MEFRYGFIGLFSKFPRYWALAVIAFLATVTFLLAQVSLLPDSHKYIDLWEPPKHHRYPLQDALDGVCDGFIEYSAHEPPHSIPNFVHFIWLAKDSSELRLDFGIFVSIYSAHLFLSPDRIFLHTDSHPDVFEAARTSKDPWTARALSLPGITPNYVTAPVTTTQGIAINHMAHRADFVRIEVLRDFGGLYLDTDAIVLRDMQSLRKSGFANILGGAVDYGSESQSSYINNGVMMARKGSLLMRLWHQAAHKFFDGGWVTASVFLVTDIADRLVAVLGEVLVLHPRAFAPVSAEAMDQSNMWHPRLKALPISNPYNTTIQNTCGETAEWATIRKVDLEPGEVDFSSTYVLHAFDSSVGQMDGWDGEIGLGYVLERKSNYARAVYPAIVHALRAGIIPESEIPEGLRAASVEQLGVRIKS